MPLTVHAAWLRCEEPEPAGHFFIWAEDTDISSRPTHPSESDRTRADARTANGRTRVRKTPSHPAQLSIAQLRSLLIEEYPSLSTAELRPVNAVAWLPTQGGVPLARRGLFHSGRADATRDPARARAARPTLEAWQVTGLALNPSAAFHLLVQMAKGTAERNQPSPSRLRAGADLLFWSNAAKFALELLVGQHFLPALRVDAGGRLEAVWQPLLLEPRVQEQHNRLVRAMPPVCRSYNLESPEDAPGPAMLTEHFVATLVDAAARAWGGSPAPEGATASAQWVRRLTAAQPALHLPPQPAHEFYHEWHAWTEQLFLVRDANFRICFVLDEPELEAGATGPGLQAQNVSWKLHYSLQAHDNPNLTVSARQVWQSSGNSVRVGQRHIDRPQERLLAGLGMASRWFAPIERSLRNPRPEMALLSTEEAYTFLREIGPLLESSGFGVQAPEWWYAGKRMRLGLRLRLSTRANGGDAHEDKHEDEHKNGDGEQRHDHRALTFSRLVDYAWELTLGGEQLTAEEFDQLAATQTPLLRARGGWIELDPEQVASARRFLSSRQPSGSMSLLQAVRVAQEFSASEGTLQAETVQTETVQTDSAANGHELPPGLIAPESVAEGLPLDSVSMTGWLRTAIERLRTHQWATMIHEPPGFVGELRPYQGRGVGWLAHLRDLGLGACLADDMGLGKTVQAIALLLHVRDRANGRRPQPALLICPTSVVANWRREIERFAPGLRCLVHHGNNRLTGAAFMEAVENHDLVITSFGTARRDIELLREWTWSDLVLDEAQNIKTPSAKQTQAVRRLRGDNRIALTGTPVENRLSELWSIMEFLNPGYLGGQEQFRRRYIVPIERYNDEARTDELRRLVQPFLLRRLKSDPTIISDLPEKNEMVVYCSLTREQAALYEQVVQDALTELHRTDGIQRRGLVLALLTKLKQIANHPAHFLKQSGPLPARSGKLNRLTEMLEEALAAGDRALVFTQFVEMGHLIQRHIGGTLSVDTLFLHGGTPAQQRDRMVQAFQSEDGPPVFVLSLRAGGSGLNLTRANHVFHYDRWWNPAVENQATDRAFRIGQLRNVQVHKFVVAGTLEERIHDLIESKQALAESIVGKGEDWLTELDTDQLRDLLMLRYEAIEDE